ncbi:hypothetical protein LJR013_003436 [Pseudarthrobacter oxydans]
MAAADLAPSTGDALDRRLMAASKNSSRTRMRALRGPGPECRVLRGR